MNREDWLNAAVTALRPIMQQRASVTLPDNIRVSCGFPKGGGRGKAHAVGQCWMQEASADGTIEMFVSPVLADSMRVLDVLTHELVHAAVGVKAGHRKPFVHAARAMLLEGKPTATHGGEAFTSEIGTPVLTTIGSPYPHAELTHNPDARKQSTRMVKCICSTCGYVARTTRKWIEIGAPICPTDRISMDVADSGEGESESE